MICTPGGVRAAMRPSSALLLATALALSGCMTGGDDEGDDPPMTPTPTSQRQTPPSPVTGFPPTPQGCDVTVEIVGGAFVPKDVTAPSGSVVCWVNKDAVEHTVTFDHGFFDSGSIAPNVTVATKMEDGLHPYHCKFHASMKGTVQMGAATTPTPTPSPTPSPTPVTPTGPTSAAVEVLAFQFTPATVTIARGGTVTWTNKDAVQHSATADDASWDTGAMAGTVGTKTLTFAQPGTFGYKCKFHSTMTGKVVVN